MVQIIDQVKKKSREDSKIRVAYVGYRDFGDKGADFDHMDVLNYTDDTETAKTKIKNSVAKGGNDPAEDVLGGLKHALTLNH